MDLLQILVLAIVQGLTEFLPISSSAHLILSPLLFGFSDQGLAFDVAVHLGSLLAIIIYLRKEIRTISIAWFSSLRSDQPGDEHSRLGWAIILGTVPIVIAGVLFKELVETDFRSPVVIAIATIGFGYLLWWADRHSRRQREMQQLRLKDAWIIGLMQVLALIPGTSRSGITMTAALMLGFSREAASRFSFLLAIPTIAMSSILVISDLIGQSTPVDWFALATGVLFSAIAAFTIIHLFLRYIGRIGMLPFAIFRILEGIVILTFVYLL